VVLHGLDGPIYLYFVTRSSSACPSFSCRSHCRVCSFLGVDSNVTDALLSVQTEILLLESSPFTSVARGPLGGQGRAGHPPTRDLPAGQEHARIGDPGAISRLQEAWSWLLGTVLVPTTLSFFGQAAGGLWRATTLCCSASGPAASHHGLGRVLAVGPTPRVPSKRRAESTASSEPLSTLVGPSLKWTLSPQLSDGICLAASCCRVRRGHWVMPCHATEALPVPRGQRHGPGTPGRAWGRWAAGGNGQKGVKVRGGGGGWAGLHRSCLYPRCFSSSSLLLSLLLLFSLSSSFLSLFFFSSLSLLLCVTTAFSPYKTAVPPETGFLQLRGASSESRIRLCCSVPPMCKELGSSKGSLPPPRLCLQPTPLRISSAFSPYNTAVPPETGLLQLRWCLL